MITSISFRNGHKAPSKSLGHLRLRELRRQPLQKFAQKAPQPPALKPPSTARTAGRSDWAERRFRRQPFILLSFSSPKKPRKALETQSYQHFQCIGHTDFNISGTNGSRLLSHPKTSTHSPAFKGSHTRAHTPKQECFGRGWHHYPRTVSHVSETLRSQGGRTAYFGDFRSRSRVLPKNAKSLRDSDTHKRIAVPRRRGPAGLRDSVVTLPKL